MSIDFSEDALARIWEKVGWNAAEKKIASLQEQLSIAAYRMDDILHPGAAVDSVKSVIKDKTGRISQKTKSAHIIGWMRIIAYVPPIYYLFYIQIRK